MVSVIVVEPETDGNVGAIARVMSNFDLSELYLINPKCDHLSQESRNRAKHAQDVLHSAKVCGFEIFDEYDTLVATTAKIGSDYNLYRSPMTPNELAKHLNYKSKIAIVIGRESSGLYNDEIIKCDYVVTIPASKNYPTLNISQACSIIFYELFQVAGVKKDKFKMIEKKDKDALLKNLDAILDSSDWPTLEKKETQRRFWKRFISKAQLTKREAMILHGFFKKVNNKR